MYDLTVCRCLLMYITVNEAHLDICQVWIRDFSSRCIQNIVNCIYYCGFFCAIDGKLTKLIFFTD